MRLRLQERERALKQARAELEGHRRELEQTAHQLAEAEQQLETKTTKLTRVRKQRQKDRTALAATRAQLDAAEGKLPNPELTVFYIVGQAKSGTTWLMRLLDAHPEIMCKGEGRIFGRGYKRPDVKRMDAPTYQPSSLYRALLDAEYLNFWIKRSVWTREGDPDEQLRRLTRATIHHFLAARAAPSNKRIVGDKTPLLSDEIVTEIATIDPSAKVIHIIRDGRDIAISAKHHIWNRSTDRGGIHDLDSEEEAIRDAYREGPADFRENGRSIFTPDWLAGTAVEWVEMTRRARDDGRRLLGDRYLELRYEDLQSDPERETAAACRFLGADPSPRVVEACVARASFERATKGASAATNGRPSSCARGWPASGGMCSPPTTARSSIRAPESS